MINVLSSVATCWVKGSDPRQLYDTDGDTGCCPRAAPLGGELDISSPSAFAQSDAFSQLRASRAPQILAAVPR